MGTRRAFDDSPPVMSSTDMCELLLIPNVQLVQRMAREGRIPAHRDDGPCVGIRSGRAAGLVAVGCDEGDT